MKTISTMLAVITGAGIIVTTLAVLALAAVPAPARAQMVTYTCEAASPFAVGAGVNVTLDSACARALRECAVRTPAGSACYVTRWWVNY